MLCAWIPHEICVFYERQTKNPDFYPTMKDFYILGREDLPFLPEVEHVGYFAARDIWAQLRGACGHITACAGTCHYAECGREPQHCRPAPSSGRYAAITGDFAGKIISILHNSLLRTPKSSLLTPLKTIWNVQKTHLHKDVQKSSVEQGRRKARDGNASDFDITD